MFKIQENEQESWQGWFSIRNRKNLACRKFATLVNDFS